jgi:peptidoglycan/LPS O-acetylase OafA/YrhL
MGEKSDAGPIWERYRADPRIRSQRQPADKGRELRILLTFCWHPPIHEQLGVKRLECLDGLRGFLAVYVLLGHMAPFALLPNWIQSAVSHGGAAVDVFFALSGLVISQSLLATGGRARPFLIARSARIFPVFLPVFAFAVMVQPLSCGFERMPWIDPDSAARTICANAWPKTWVPEIMAHLTMTHGLFPDNVLPDVWVSFLGSAWSLSTEWQFYVLALLAYGRGRHFYWLLLSLGAAGAAWRLHMPEAWQFSRAFLANKAHFFALGMAAVPLVRQENGCWWRYGFVLAGCMLVCATEGPPVKALPPLVWTLCLVIQLWPEIPVLRVVNRVLRSRVAQYLGAVSYCLYLVNEPIQKLAGGLLSWLAAGNAVVFTLLWLPVAIALPLLAAACLHVHIEVPGLRWGRSIARRPDFFPAGMSVQGRARGL